MLKYAAEGRLEELDEKMTDLPLQYSVELLQSLPQEAQRTVEGVMAVCSAAVLVFKHTPYDQDGPNKLPLVIFEYLKFLRETAGAKLPVFVELSLRVVVPKAWGDIGLPFFIEGIEPLLAFQEGRELTYQMLCAAARLQVRAAREVLLAFHPSAYAACSSRLQTAIGAGDTGAVVLASMMLMISPKQFGPLLWQLESCRLIFLKFIEAVCEVAMLNQDHIDDCKFNAVPDEPRARLNYIMQFARLSCLSPTMLIACEDPDFLAMLIEQADPFPVLPWISVLPDKYVARFSLGPLLQYVLMRLVGIVDEAKGMPVAHIFTPSVLHPFAALVDSRVMSEQDVMAQSHSYAVLLASEHRAVRVGAYTLISLINADQAIQKPGETGKATRASKPRFRVPDDPGIADILLKAILIDSEAPMSTAYIEHLAASKGGADKLAELARRRPLLVACLQHTGLAARLPSQSVQYDTGQPIGYRYIEYASLKVMKKPQPPSYHVLLTPVPPRYALVDLPSDDEPEEVLQARPLIELRFPTFSRVDLEVYRCEIALAFASHQRLVRFFAVAALKRLVSADIGAFLRFARPTLSIVSSEVTHNSLIHRDGLGLFLCFLIICRYRLESVARPLSPTESSFFSEELAPALLSIDQNQLEGDALILGLRATLLRTNTAEGDLARVLVPLEFSFGGLVYQSNRWPAFRDSLLVSDDGYAERWLGKMALHIPDFGKAAFSEQVILPLLLSCKKDSVTLFLAELARVDQAAAAELRRGIQRAISELYVGSGFPLTREV
jgi:hypothetical protein